MLTPINLAVARENVLKTCQDTRDACKKTRYPINKIALKFNDQIITIICCHRFENNACQANNHKNQACPYPHDGNEIFAPIKDVSRFLKNLLPNLQEDMTLEEAIAVIKEQIQKALSDPEAKAPIKANPDKIEKTPAAQGADFLLKLARAFTDSANCLVLPPIDNKNA